MKFIRLTIFAVVASAIAGCSTQQRSAHANNPRSAIAKPQSYTRVANLDTNTIALQLAVREFMPLRGRGPVIWLVGAMHVGEPEYYQSLQKFLDAQTVVLYEGINTGAHPRHVPQPGEIAVKGRKSSEPQTLTPTHSSGESGQSSDNSSDSISPSSANAPFSMQAALAHSLGLVFQLDAIDYDRTNFLNSDLGVRDIQKLMVADTNPVATLPSGPATNSKPARGGNQTFDALLQVMDGTSFMGSLFKMGIQFIGANPKLQAITKLSLIEAIGDLKGDMSTMSGMPPELSQLVRVLIQARNQHVVADVQTELKLMPRSGSIAIFYGTGHMDDMEKRITSHLHYKLADEKWFTAFSVDCKKSNLSPAEVRFTRTLMKSQMEQMQ